MDNSLPNQITQTFGEPSLNSLAVTPQNVYEHVYSTKAEAILQEWKQQCHEERQIRRQYAKWTLIVLVLQSLGFFIIMLLIGIKKVELSDTVINIFVISVLGEMFGLATLIYKYLFNSGSEGSIINLIKDA